MKMPSVKILLLLHEKGEVRYTEFTKIISSRGTLSLNLKDLEEGLVKRKIVTTKPIQSYYSLTEKGRKVTELLARLSEVIGKEEPKIPPSLGRKGNRV